MTALEIQDTDHPVLVGERSDDPALVIVEDTPVYDQRPTGRGGARGRCWGDGQPANFAGLPE